MSPILNIILFFTICLIGYFLIIYRESIHALVSKKHFIKTSKENILKLLYHVQSSNKLVGFDALAGALKIRPKLLLQILDEMADSELILIHDDTIRLTDQGKSYGLHIVRTHRLWEKYLAEHTGVDKKDWHDLAERKEHFFTPEETEQLYKDLGRPRFDPHGDPIPTESGEIIRQEGELLPNLSTGTIARIVHIEDEPKVVYDQLLKQKLHLGAVVEVKKSTDRTVDFISEGTPCSLSTILASNISVRPLSDMELTEESGIRLSNLEEGEMGIVVGISSECRGSNRRRLLDLGFVKGAKIKAELDSPLKNPKAYLVKNSLIALRKDQADHILITKDN